MSSTIPPCPQCQQENTYPDQDNYVCADCGHEWPQSGVATAEAETRRVVRDANGTELQDGDTVIVAKDLKVKGTSTTLKVGTKIKGIRIVDGDHEVDCKTEFGAMMLKAMYLKKA